MTPDTTIEEQARREAEAKYPMDHYTHQVMREAYISALIAERSKPQPSVDQIMEVVKVWHNYTDMVPKDAEDLMMNETQEEAYENLRDRLTKLFKQ